jgi:hypothetical protein
MDSSESVTLISPVETLSKRYRPGHQFHVRSWWETPAGRVADLVDAAGVLRVSHCPIERFVSVSQTEACDAEFIVCGSRSDEPIVDRESPEAVALPGRDWDCPFEPSPPIEIASAGQRRPIERPSSELVEPATPVLKTEYFRSDRLEFHNSTRWPLSAEHPLRGVWGPEWKLADACVLVPDYSGTCQCARMICFATRLDRPEPTDISQAKYSGPEWRFWVDLNNEEFREWAGPWQALTAPTDSESAADVAKPETTDSTPEAAETAVTSHTKPTVAPWLCQFGEYPEPSADWTVDQLRGWRTVRDRDGTICGKFGPDAPEQKHEWAAWLVRVQEFEKGLKS